jgi:hypothetical protein
MWFFEMSGTKLVSQVTAISLPSRATSVIVIPQPSAGQALATGAVDVDPAAVGPEAEPSEGSSLPHATRAKVMIEAGTMIRWNRFLDSAYSSIRSQEPRRLGPSEATR